MATAANALAIQRYFENSLFLLAGAGFLTLAASWVIGTAMIVLGLVLIAWGIALLNGWVEFYP